MTDTPELIARLRERADYEDNGGVAEKMLFDIGALLRDAADALSRLQAEVARLRGVAEARLAFIKIVEIERDEAEAIIADHEEQQLHEAMHGTIGDPLDAPEAPRSPVAKLVPIERAEAAEAEIARLRKAVEEAVRILTRPDGESAHNRIYDVAAILTAALQPEKDNG